MLVQVLRDEPRGGTKPAGGSGIPSSLLNSILLHTFNNQRREEEAFNTNRHQDGFLQDVVLRMSA
jgi:hypothetical protein